MAALRPLSPVKSLESDTSGKSAVGKPKSGMGISGKTKPRAHFAGVKPFKGTKQFNSGIGKPLSLSNQKGNQY